MVLCLICWGVYAGVKKAHQTMEERKWVQLIRMHIVKAENLQFNHLELLFIYREKKRIKNGEKVSPSDEKAILASSSSSSSECACSTVNGEHKTCRSCKAALVEEVPPPYHEATSGSSRAVMTTAAWVTSTCSTMVAPHYLVFLGSRTSTLLSWCSDVALLRCIYQVSVSPSILVLLWS